MRSPTHLNATRTRILIRVGQGLLGLIPIAGQVISDFVKDGKVALKEQEAIEKRGEKLRDSHFLPELISTLRRQGVDTSGTDTPCAASHLLKSAEELLKCVQTRTGTTWTRNVTLRRKGEEQARFEELATKLEQFDNALAEFQAIESARRIQHSHGDTRMQNTPPFQLPYQLPYQLPAQNQFIIMTSTQIAVAPNGASTQMILVMNNVPTQIVDPGHPQRTRGLGDDTLRLVHELRRTASTNGNPGLQHLGNEAANGWVYTTLHRSSTSRVAVDAICHSMA